MSRGLAGLHFKGRCLEHLVDGFPDDRAQLVSIDARHLHGMLAVVGWGGGVVVGLDPRNGTFRTPGLPRAQPGGAVFSDDSSRVTSSRTSFGLFAFNQLTISGA